MRKVLKTNKYPFNKESNRDFTKFYFSLFFISESSYTPFPFRLKLGFKNFGEFWFLIEERWEIFRRIMSPPNFLRKLIQVPF